MMHIADLPDDMMIPDELGATHEAIRAAADSIVPERAFLDALDARVQRERMIAAPAVSAFPSEDHEVADRGEMISARVRDRADAGTTTSGTSRTITRRGVLVGSVAATAAALFATLERTRNTALNIPATQQARSMFVTAQMVAAAPPVAATGTVGQPSNLDFADSLVGWGLWGSHPNDYDDGIDPTVMQHGAGSAYLRSKVPDPSGFGTLARTFSPDAYRGSRVRMTGTVKADAVDNWAGLWMRVDGASQQILSFDNMQGRPITGTRDWQTYDIVLDVPQESTLLAFGILLAGKGSVWLNDVTFEIVGQDMPTTDAMALPAQMQNLDFEAGTAGWLLAGDEPQGYRIGTDTGTVHSGKASGYLRADRESPSGFGTLMQMVQVGSYPGARVRMSGWAKADGVADEAGLWMRVDGPDTRKTGKSLSLDNMQNRPIKGTSDWTRYEIVLDVPQAATALAFGILLQGKGAVWFDDVQFTVVGPDVPTTNMLT